MKNREVRSFNLNADNDSRLISGYAIVFNSMSNDLGGFREIISPTAVTEELIANSDVVFNYAHNDNNILARSNKGEGTLELSVDERGLYFAFEMPKTALGDQILESIKRGDISKCSFCFSLDNDECETWTRDADNNIIRTINSISGLYDCAIVVHPAYDETEVSNRSLEKVKELRALDEEEPEDEKDPEEKTESNNEDEQTNDNADSDSNNSEESTDDKESEEQRNVEQTNTEKNKQNIKSKTMEKRFSLLKTINDIANGKKLDDVTNAVLAEGRNAFVKSGKEFSGQIQLPIGQPLEKRDTITVEAEGEDVVVTDFMNILAPLRAENVLAKAGARFITGLKGDLQFPIMSAENVYWEGETTTAKDGAGSFTNLKMSPRRISAYIDVSKQFLIQDTLDAESLIRQDLINAINSKIEETILGEAAAQGYRPAGIFYNVTPTYVDTFAKLCDLEADVEETNIGGEMKYILSPKAKSALRSMPKSSKHTQLVLDAATIDGTPFETTTNMGQYKFAYGAWNNLAIGVWSGADLTIDPYTQATKACVRIIVDAFVDFKVLRDGAIVYGTVHNG